MNTELWLVDRMLAGARQVLRSRYRALTEAIKRKESGRVTRPLKDRVKVALSIVTALKDQQKQMRKDVRAKT